MKPSQKWEHEASSAPVRTAQNRELCLAFGRRTMRKVTQSGIRCMGIDYQTPALVRLFAGTDRTRPNLPEKVEIAFWEHDIGAIQVKVAPDEWLTVTATDERWLGKDFAHLLMVRGRPETQEDEGGKARLRAIYEMDQEAYRLKSLAKLALPAMTDADFDYWDEKLTRFMRTAQDAFAPVQPLGLLDGDGDDSELGVTSDPVGPGRQHESSSLPASTPTAAAAVDGFADRVPVVPFDDDDLME